MASEMQPQNARLKVSIVVTVGLFYQNYIRKSEPPLVTSPGQQHDDSLAVEPTSHLISWLCFLADERILD